MSQVIIHCCNGRGQADRRQMQCAGVAGTGTREGAPERVSESDALGPQAELALRSAAEALTTGAQPDCSAST